MEMRRPVALVVLTISCIQLWLVAKGITITLPLATWKSMVPCPWKGRTLKVRVSPSEIVTIGASGSRFLVLSRWSAHAEVQPGGMTAEGIGMGRWESWTTSYRGSGRPLLLT